MLPQLSGGISTHKQSLTHACLCLVWTPQTDLWPALLAITHPLKFKVMNYLCQTFQLNPWTLTIALWELDWN